MNLEEREKEKDLRNEAKQKKREKYRDREAEILLEGTRYETKEMVYSGKGTRNERTTTADRQIACGGRSSILRVIYTKQTSCKQIKFSENLSHKTLLTTHLLLLRHFLPSYLSPFLLHLPPPPPPPLLPLSFHLPPPLVTLNSLPPRPPLPLCFPPLKEKTCLKSKQI